MSAIKFNVEVTLTQMSCDSCGGVFAITEDYRSRRQDQGGNWHCPYCGQSWFYTENRNDKLKEENQKLARRLELEKNRRDSAEKSLVAQKGVNIKLKNRIKHGVCPCCHRTFKQLASHMKNKHPDYSIK